MTVTATRKALDRLRREERRDAKHREAAEVHVDAYPAAGTVEDDRLRLIFICCHPALSMDARVALTLRLVGGLTVPEIAAAFLMQETTMGQRISRAKAKIAANRIPCRVPAQSYLLPRLDAVLAVLLLIYNEGYLATGPATAPLRSDLTAEAIRLARLLRELLPHEGEVVGLLALMLLTEARRSARVAEGGALVPLPEQDRSAWDPRLIEEGHRLVRGRLAVESSPGRYQLLAAISAVQTDAQPPDWRQIVALYDRLVSIDASPVVAPNRAVAVVEVDGPTPAPALIDGLASRLDRYHPFHVARAELLHRLDRTQEPIAAFDAAIELVENRAELAHLVQRRRDLLRALARESNG